MTATNHIQIGDRVKVIFNGDQLTGTVVEIQDHSGLPYYKVQADDGRTVIRSIFHVRPDEGPDELDSHYPLSEQERRDATTTRLDQMAAVERARRNSPAAFTA